MKVGVIFLFLTLILAILLASSSQINRARAQHRTLIVDDDGPADCKTIEEAIGSAFTGDVIFVKNGTYYEHVIVDKEISLVGEDREAAIIDGNGTWTVVYVSAPNVLLENLTIRNAEPTFPGRACVYMYRTTNLTVQQSILKNGDTGILLWRDCSNALFRNNQISNTSYGIKCDYSSTDISIIRNHIFSARIMGVSTNGGNENFTIVDNIVENVKGGVTTSDAIDLFSTHDVLVARNNISLYTNKGISLRGECTNIVIDKNHLTNGEEGISVQNSQGITITGNIIRNQSVSNVTGTGINIDSSSYLCTIVENTIADNYGAISLANGGHTIFHNNFINNTFQANVTGSSTWDDGYPSGGNYWSDYSGVDLNGAPTQNETGADGLGDTPYYINDYNIDNYPLTRSQAPSPWLSIDPKNVTTTELGYEFNVTLRINEVDPRIRLAGAQFRLRYNTTILETKENWAFEGNFLKDSAARANLNTSFEVYVEEGEIVVNVLIVHFSTLPKTAFPIGTGDLATIGFNATFQNPAEDTDSTLQIYNITLADSEIAEVSPDLQKTEEEGQCFYRISSLLPPSDLNRDRTVNILDVSIVAVAFGSTPGTPNWNSAADLNHDGQVNIVDVVSVAKDYGKTV